MTRREDRGNRGSDVLRLTKIFHLLQARRRREIIRIVHEKEPTETMALRDLAREVAAKENDRTPSQIRNKEYRTCYNALSQQHLPALDDGDIVTYDDERQVVARGANITAARVTLEVATPPITRLFLDITSDEEDPLQED